MRDVFVLSAPVSGRTRRIEVEVGDVVRADDTIVAEIEPADPTPLDARTEGESEAAVRAAEAALGTARSEVTRAEAELEFARGEFQRQTRLREGGVVAERDFDSARKELRSRRAAREMALAALRERSFELDRARARLRSPLEASSARGPCECIPIRSPVSGVVLRVLRESEGVVGPGDPLLEIGDASDLEIVVDVLSADAVRIEPGFRVRVDGWGGDSRSRGACDESSPSHSPRSRRSGSKSSG